MKAKCEAIFRSLDLNGDGRITKAEFIKALRGNSSLAETFHLPAEIREGVAHAQFESVYQGIDTSGDRVISFEELQTWFGQQQGVPLVQARPVPVATLAITN
jgi:Ca2+-binding EF-hand superfamily protein